MKIIIDANVVSHFNNRSQEAKCILDWLKSKGHLSTGGHNLVELNRTRVRDLVIQLIKAGRGSICPKDDIDTVQQTFTKRDLVSDDPHVIALAIAGGARLLFTNDQPLMEDFKNQALVNKPRGSIYQDASIHNHLLI